MKSFHWDQHFVTHVPEVDTQHYQLVETINQFGNLLTDDVIDIEDVDKLYNQLSSYAIEHFQSEESLMQEAKLIPEYIAHHHLVHGQFLNEVNAIYTEVTQDNIQEAERLLQFLIHWLAYHILGEDQFMARQMKAIEGGLAPQQAYEQLKREKNSETAPLLKALDGLFEQVSLRNRELKQLNDSLEEKVAQRTEELHQANRHLEELSLTDTLTGLPNRRHAMGFLAQSWQHAIEHDTPLVCIMIDADHFKAINDTCGHDAGDKVLKALATTLKQSFRNDDLVCRLGGDEFFVICPNTDHQGGMNIAEIVCQTVSELRVSTGSSPWHGSISVGVASRTTKTDSYEALIKLADQGVYAAKSAGKGCVRTAN
ncbi:diguanylate cyclase [Corallincola holothuriorum]|uniref:diguanylate cyclase n=1 Tax=Corallincola holothuriorum TaxID=2282215 RepID=A0A368NK24_9GAMM|nr:diguanylate cyclase [Corallincola holothuriorum]RCU50450.1 diguanylate cyclase [Corallincola holothuriorum]